MSAFDFGVAFIVLGLGLCIYAYNAKPSVQIAIAHGDGEAAVNVGNASGPGQYAETYGKGSTAINIRK